MKKDWKSFIDFIEVEKQYSQNQMSLDDIAKTLSICRNTLAKELRARGVVIRQKGGSKKKWCNEEYERLKKYVTNGLTTSDIARRENVGFHTVRLRLIKYGLR